MSASLTIVGAGPAGLSAAIYAASEGLAVTVIDPHPERGGQAGSAIAIRNLLGFPAGISGHALMRRAYRQARAFGVRFLADRAVRIARNGSLHVQLEGNDRISTDAILLTLGVQYRRLEVPGASTVYGIYYGLDHDQIPAWADKHVAIIGGANSAGQAALALANAGARVTIVSRSLLSARMSAYLTAALRAHRERVTIHDYAEVQSFDQIDGNRVGLTIGVDGENLTREVDAVFTFIGAVPQTDWLPLDKDAHGFLTCGHGTFPAMCSMPGVFAAGDVRSGSTKRVGAAIGDAAAAIAQIHTYLTQTQKGNDR